jgi:hypothetical protein
MVLSILQPPIGISYIGYRLILNIIIYVQNDQQLLP